MKPIIPEAAAFIGTSNHGFTQYAQDEIKRLIPGAKYKALVPTEVFLLEAPNLQSEVLNVINNNEPIFLRHLHPVDAIWETERSELDITYMIEWLQELNRFTSGEKVAVQVRKEERSDAPYTSYGIKAALDEILIEAWGAEPVVREADFIISIYVTSTKLYAGISRPEDNLSDWSGGAVRFQKEEHQISRAKFKLLEAEQKFKLDFSQFRTGLDIGAAPGGWTSFLLERGLRVTAIDPADMHASFVHHPMLTFLKKNAGDVKLKDEQFELLVCDMSWSPRQMGHLVTDLLYALKRGGTAIITVKLMHKKPFQTVRELVQDFEPNLKLMKAKQLFHNREELTLYLVKP
jgi:23S rRNA (cytidine2498-2'-O)-methyltransferase